MSKVRVYELAKELGMDNKDVVDRLAGLGVAVKNHMGVLEASDVERLKRTIQRANTTPAVEERIRPTVVRRKKANVPAEEEQPAAAAPASAAAQSPARSAPGESASESHGHAPSHRDAEDAPSRPSGGHGGQSQHGQQPSASQAAQSSQPGHGAAHDTREASAPSAAHKATDTGASQPAQPTSASESQAHGGEAPAEKPAPRAQVPESRPRIAEVSRTDTRRVAALLPPDAPGPGGQPGDRSSVAPMADRFAHAHLPPGVMRRGNAAAPTAASRLTDADRARIVAEHVASRPDMPRRREIRGRQSIGPAARPMARLGKKRLAPGKKPMMPNITVPSEKKRVIRIEDQIQLQMLASRMSLKATELLMKLMQLGMSGVHINSTLDADTASLLASEFGYEVENVGKSEDDIVSDARGTFDDHEVDREARPPVVTVMGHVDHGKTSLLDKIRRTKVASGEAGGITQHIGAYRVETERGPIVFLDTPGHEAFTSMRMRGAQATDIVILVVAADDGVMPQTKEAIKHAKAAGVPIVVAINKIDKPDAKIERVKQELAGEGVQAEDWGGDVLMVACSAHTGEGIDQLLEGVLLTAEILQLSSNSKVPAEGIVLEAYLDRGRGPVANVLVRNGSLRPGDFVSVGSTWGRVRALTDDRGKQVRVAGPATPVEVLGLQELPSAGDHLYKVTDQKKAQEFAESRRPTAIVGPSATARGLDQLQQLMLHGEVKELRILVKADVQGSLEALNKSFSDLSTDKVKVLTIHNGVGGITENDIMLAAASNAIVMGFNVRPQGKAAALAKNEGVEIRFYSIIYEAIDEVKLAMVGLLPPRLVEKELGEAQVRSVFSITKVGAVSGCMVTEGKLVRAAKVRVVRDGVIVWTGPIHSLRRFKDDVKEVTHGFECGVTLNGFTDVKEGDVYQCFEVESVAATL